MSDRAGAPRSGDATEANAGSSRRDAASRYDERKEAMA
jgi:hypothetical protein